MPDLRILCAAIRDHDGTVYSVPVPGRHHDVIRVMIHEHGCKKPVTGDQGFVASDGRFVDREIARRIAVDANQFKRDDPRVPHHATDLFSEDLW